MQIIGYISYGVLIFFAIAWTRGVRTELGLGIPTILGAWFYVIAAIALYILEIPKIHSLWLLPSGFAFVMLCNFIISAKISLLSGILKMVGSLYASIIRIGISKEQIELAQHMDDVEAVRNWQKQK